MCRARAFICPIYGIRGLRYAAPVRTVVLVNQSKLLLPPRHASIAVRPHNVPMMAFPTALAPFPTTLSAPPHTANQKINTDVPRTYSSGMMQQPAFTQHGTPCWQNPTHSPQTNHRACLSTDTCVRGETDQQNGCVRVELALQATTQQMYWAIRHL